MQLWPKVLPAALFAGMIDVIENIWAITSIFTPVLLTAMMAGIICAACAEFAPESSLARVLQIAVRRLRPSAAKTGALRQRARETRVYNG